MKINEHDVSSSWILLIFYKWRFDYCFNQVHNTSVGICKYLLVILRLGWIAAIFFHSVIVSYECLLLLTVGLEELTVLFLLFQLKVPPKRNFFLSCKINPTNMIIVASRNCFVSVKAYIKASDFAFTICFLSTCDVQSKQK